MGPLGSNFRVRTKFVATRRGYKGVGAGAGAPPPEALIEFFQNSQKNRLIQRGPKKNFNKY